jgi:glycyl-tRNA synthetase (class II)
MLEVYEGKATIEKVAALARRRGFVYPSSDIYGGLGSSYDYGHYGVLLKQNVKAEWQRSLVQEREDIVLLDSAIILHPQVWVASGHVGGFSDPLVDCRTCKLRFRADHLEQSACGRRPSKHPGETPDCDLTEARQFNLMFETSIGPVRDEGSLAYLRPETAQGIFVNFKNVTSSLRVKPPFGIAQIGKSFRNEITPGNFLFRMREFEQMEMEFFVPPAEAPRWFDYWVDARRQWYLDLGLRESHLRVRPHEADELSHYSSGTSDLEYLFPIGWSELEGIANRGDFDLTQHANASGTKLERHAHRAAPPPAPRAGEGRRAAARREGRGARVEGARAVRGPAPRHARRVRRVGVDRQAVPPSGRDRDAVGADDRPADGRGRNGHDPRPRHARAGADPAGGSPRRARRQARRAVATTRDGLRSRPRKPRRQLAGS